MRLVLLDSASLYFRSFFALPESLTAPDGTPVNAVRGFADTIARIITERRPGRLVACLDADWRPAFRVAALPSYKAHRVAAGNDTTPNDTTPNDTTPNDTTPNDTAPDGAEEVPDALTVQVPIILDLLDAAGLATAEATGFEADDVIGTLTAREQRDAVEVITGDRDLFQVVREFPTPARVIYLGRGWAHAELIGPAELAARYGLPEINAGPAYADMAVLRGDPSDGLPGVTGIGEKTAAKLITEFGNLTALLAAARDNDPKVPARARTKLAAAAEYLAAAPNVVRVVTDAPVRLNRRDEVPIGPADSQRLVELQLRWNLGGSVDRLIAALASRVP